MRHSKFILTALVIMTLLFSSCKTTEYIEVPVETVRTEYITKRDSVYIHDSIDVFREQKGDTLYISKTKYKLKTVIRTDTIMKTDSIPVVVTVTKTVLVNKLYFWLKWLMYLGIAGVFMLLGVLLYKFKVWKLLF